MDDWNWKYVRDGTFDSIKKLNLQILFDRRIRLTWDNSHTPKPEASQTWWNGMYVAILQKNIETSQKNIETLKINYINNSCELGEIGKKYDTDKSSQRYNGYCHPYTLFYDGLFKDKKKFNQVR